MMQYEGFENITELYGITAYVILISILIHGVTAPSIIGYFKSARKDSPGAEDRGD